jgi:hypothetical protein
MDPGYVIVLLSLVTPGGADVAPAPWIAGLGVAAARHEVQAPARLPEEPPTQPATPQPVKPQAEPAEPTPAPASPAPPPGTPVGEGERKESPPAAEQAAAAPLDLKMLEQQLRNTKAIGFFTKISLKNKVDDLLDDFGDYYGGKVKITLTTLRRSYELLIMKVLSLLQDEDPTLARAIVASREAIWAMLTDPGKFATLRG